MKIELLLVSEENNIYSFHVLCSDAANLVTTRIMMLETTNEPDMLMQWLKGS